MTPVLDESEQAKQELLSRLRAGKLEGIESILDKIRPGNALHFSFYKDLDPKVVDDFYTIAIKYYEGKKHCQLAPLWKYMQKTHRAKYMLELEDVQ
ncbi:MAG: hypothetical protein NTY99_00495 [DPANN group archaeon]|nr:hypothetical protein [DPANN group archaeon]